MTRRPTINELTSAQLFERAAEFSDKAKARDTHHLVRDAFSRLALRYAVLATERRAAESQAVRH
jgi:hypothetical protein